MTGTSAIVKTIAVTGATGGIGEAVVEALAAAGYRVVALGRSPEKLEALSRFGDVVTMVHDLASLDDIEGVDRLDGLVHCAGVAEVASLEDTPRELWEETFAANVTGPAAL